LKWTKGERVRPGWTETNGWVFLSWPSFVLYYAEGTLGATEWKMAVLKAARAQFVVDMKTTSQAESAVFVKLSGVCQNWRETIVTHRLQLRRAFNCKLKKHRNINSLTPIVAIWLQLWSILCQTGLSQSFVVIFDIRALWRSGLSVIVPGCQILQTIGLTRSDTGCFIAVPILQQRASKG